MFRGTMKKKTPSVGVAMAMSLEELDRPIHCPENVDEESWLHLVKIRRTKIDSEKIIAALDGDISETAQVCTTQGLSIYFVYNVFVITTTKKDVFIDSKSSKSAAFIC